MMCFVGLNALATDIVWTNSAGGPWGTAANWSPNIVPGAGDTAWVTNNGSYTVTLNISAAVDTLFLGGTSGTQTLSHVAGTLSLANGGTVSSNGSYVLAGGTLAGAGTLTVASTFSFVAGAFGGTDSVHPTGINLVASGGVGLSGLGTKYLYGGTLLNAGVMTWASSMGPVVGYTNALLTNAPAGVLDFQGDGSPFVQFGSAVLANAGTLRKSAGTGTTTIGFAFNNSGLVQAQSGTLNFSGGGISSGQFACSNTASLSFGGGTHLLEPGASVSGAGTVDVSGGVVTVQGQLLVGALTNSGGTLVFSSGGTPVVTNLTLNGGTVLGSDSLVVAGPFTWLSGAFGGSNGTAPTTISLNAAGGVFLRGNVTKYLYGGTLINAGPGNWVSAAATVVCYTNALFTNAPGGTYDFSGDGTPFTQFGTAILANGGTLRKTAGTGTTTISLPINNGGLVEGQSGLLTFNAGGSSSGQFLCDNGAAVGFGGGTQVLQGTSSLNGPGSVLVSAGSVIVQGQVVVGALTNSSGAVNFSSGGTPTITNLTLSGGALIGSDAVSVPGVFNWSAGAVGGTNGPLPTTFGLTANGGVLIGGNVTKYFYGGAVTNAGPGSWVAGAPAIACYTNSLFANAMGGTFDFQGDGIPFIQFGSAVLANAGLLRKVAATGTTTINLSCNNSGSVQALSGTLDLGAGGTSSGQFVAAPGADLMFGGGTHSLQSASLVTGAGAINVSSGTVNIQGQISAGSWTNTGGTVAFSSGGTPTITNLTVTGGAFTGSDALNVQGVFNWIGGSLGGLDGQHPTSLSLLANGGVVITGNLTKYLYGATLVNAGPGSWNSGAASIACYTNSLFANAATGTFDFQTDGIPFLQYGSAALANAGVLRKTGGTGTTTINLPCNNTGLVLGQSGTLSLGAGGISSGQFVCAATIDFAGTHTFQTGSSLVGAGTASVSGGTLVVQGQMMVGSMTNTGGTVDLVTGGSPTITNLTLSGGALIGTDALTVPGSLNWNGGALGGVDSTHPTTLSVTAGGGLFLGGGLTKYLYGGTLLNAGPGSWNGAPALACYPNAILTNLPGATFDFQTDGVPFIEFGSVALGNGGTLRKTGGAGTTTVNLPCINSGLVQAGAGTLSFASTYIQTAGQTLLAGGGFNFSGYPLQLRGGTLAGVGTVTGSVSNSAIVSPGFSPGLLTISGNYTETPGAQLMIELGGTTPGTGYDQLSVGGTAALAGTLNVSLYNGFVPAPGDVFTCLVCHARSGVFPVVQGPSPQWSAVYFNDHVVVRPGNAPPIAHLAISGAPIACHTVLLQASGNDPDGSVTNLTLLLGTNVLGSFGAATAQLAVSYDFPGPVTFTAIATDNEGGNGGTNVVETFTTLPVDVLDALGFQTNKAFKLCMEGDSGTNYKIQSRDSLSQSNWTDLGTMEVTNGIWRYLDSTASNSTHRFYRAAQLP